MENQGRGLQSRRQLLRTALGAAGIAIGAPFLRLSEVRAQAIPEPPGTLKLADDLFVIRIPGQANIVAHTDANGVLLVDGGTASASDAVLKAVSELPGAGKVHTLFNTHWHPEQTGLNERLGQAGATIIAHENTRLWLTQNVVWPWNGQRFNKLSKIAQPSKTFYTTGELDSGIRYGYIADAAHTDGDIYVYFPKQNVLAVGGALSGKGWPVVDWWTGGWIGGMSGALNRLQTVANADTQIIPADGPVMHFSDLEEQSEMYATLYGRLSQMLNKGRGPTEAVEAKPAQEFEAKMGDSDEFVRRSFESLWAYLSPDA